MVKDMENMTFPKLKARGQQTALALMMNAMVFLVCANAAIARENRN